MREQTLFGQFLDRLTLFLAYLIMRAHPFRIDAFSTFPHVCQCWMDVQQALLGIVAIWREMFYKNIIEEYSRMTDKKLYNFANFWLFSGVFG